MATLTLKGTFNFYKQARDITPQMNSWLNELRAIDILINILKIKIKQSKTDENEEGIDDDFEGAGLVKNNLSMINELTKLFMNKYYTHDLIGGVHTTNRDLNKVKELNKIYFLRGRTGSGKSTFMIQELYKNIILKGSSGIIFCSEPRVILTKSNPLDVLRYNPTWKLGKNVGILNGSEKIEAKERSAIYYGTTQILNDLLNGILHDKDVQTQLFKIKNYKIIVVDECHILDAPMISLLKTIWNVINKLGRYAQCPLFIFSSATIDVIKMVQYYSKAINDCSVSDVLHNPLMIGEIQGKSNYEVKEIFIENNEMNELVKKEKESNVSAFKLYVTWFWNHYGKILYKSDSFITVNNKNVQCRDVLLFVPLFSAIELMGECLEKLVENEGLEYMRITKGTSFKKVEEWRNSNRKRKRILYVAFGRNYAHASDEILSKSLDPDEEVREYETKIIASTSVIETGKTISTLHICFNIGIETMAVYNPLIFKFENFVDCIKQVPCNKNQVIQRVGRVGRECPGIFVHFYTKQTYNEFKDMDVADTINNAYLSNMVLNSLINDAKLYDYVDLFNMNNYYQPISLDILINTARDLINAGYLTGLGQFVALKNSLFISEDWLMYAKFLFYILGWSLWDALLMASINRKSLPGTLNLYDVNPATLKFQLKDYKIANEETAEAVKRARNAMTKILYGNDRTFKCSNERIYKPLKIEVKNEH